MQFSRLARQRRFSSSAEAHLKRSAVAAFTDWHASDLTCRLLQKCAKNTNADRALLRTARFFTLHFADVQHCTVGDIVAEQCKKTFLTPVGQLHFVWACCHSRMPMELPLRWSCSLLLRPADAIWMPTPADPEWHDAGGFAVLAVGAMEPAARGPPTTSFDAASLRSLLDAMEKAAAEDISAGSAEGASTSTPLSRAELEWLISFLCGEPSDFAFDSLSGTLASADV